MLHRMQAEAVSEKREWVIFSCLRMIFDVGFGERDDPRTTSDAFYDAFFTGFGFGWGSFTTFGENSPVTGFFVFPRILNLSVANVMTALRTLYLIPFPAGRMSLRPIKHFHFRGLQSNQ